MAPIIYLSKSEGENQIGARGLNPPQHMLPLRLAQRGIPKTSFP